MRNNVILTCNEVTELSGEKNSQGFIAARGDRYCKITLLYKRKQEYWGLLHCHFLAGQHFIAGFY